MAFPSGGRRSRGDTTNTSAERWRECHSCAHRVEGEEQRLLNGAALIELHFKAKHAKGEHTWGVDGNSGKLVDMKSYGLFESASVKVRIHLGSN